MIRLVLVLAIILPALAIAQDENGAIRIGGGYVHDFPGMNGFGVFAEYSRPLAEKWQAAIGCKWSDTHGVPRTMDVKEFTRAAAMDFNLYFLPIQNESHEIRLGAGYSFSFYTIRRTYPLVSNEGGSTTTQWPIQDEKGRTGGFNLAAEYQYHFVNTNISIGTRGAWFKAYDGVLFVGAFVGVRL